MTRNHEDGRHLLIVFTSQLGCGDGDEEEACKKKKRLTEILHHRIELLVLLPFPVAGTVRMHNSEHKGQADGAVLSWGISRWRVKSQPSHSVGIPTK